MPDRENVIKKLEILRDLCNAKSIMAVGDGKVAWDGYANTADDALELLKEDCHNCKLECLLQKYDELKEKYDALLKEKESVEPKCQIIFDVPYYFCGSCKTMLNMYATKAKYCSNCARRVKWK